MNLADLLPAPGPCRVVATLLLALGLMLGARHVVAQETFVLQRPSCYPIYNALNRTVIDYRVDMRAELDVLVWYCDTPEGMEENYRVGSFGNPCEQCFREDITSVDQLYVLDKGAFRRPLKEAETTKLAAVESRYEPRCTVFSDAKTTGVRGVDSARKITAAKLDEAGKKVSIDVATAKASCWSWVRARAGYAERYCSVRGQTDTAGRVLGADSYVPCRMAKAPAAGWPQ
jgi:hypothetical protein